MHHARAVPPSLRNDSGKRWRCQVANGVSGSNPKINLSWLCCRAPGPAFFSFHAKRIAGPAGWPKGLFKLIHYTSIEELAVSVLKMQISTAALASQSGTPVLWSFNNVVVGTLATGQAGLRTPNVA
jgi:hypothetical protein